MKKIFVSLAALVVAAFTTTASAQAIMSDDSNPWRFGIQLGYNVPSFSETQYNSTFGWNMGVSALYDTQNFIPNSYVRASVLYTRKGTDSGLDEIGSYKFKNLNSHLHYLEVPLHFGYAYEANDLMCLIAETGPYFAFRFSGSIRTDQTWKNNEEIEATKGDLKDYYHDLRRFDIGWGARVGVMFDKKYEVSLGYDWGLCEAIKEVSGPNLNLSINATVYFD